MPGRTINGAGVMQEVSPRGADAAFAPLAAGFAAYSIWGLQPLLFIAAAGRMVRPDEIVALRTIGAFACAAVVLVVQSRRFWRELPALPWRTLLLSALLMGGNWWLYVWSATTHRLGSASLGYFILPLMNVVCGALFFDERLDAYVRWAVAPSAAGLAIIWWSSSDPPWVALGLATSFCAYGVLKKRLVVAPQLALFCECGLLIVPAALIEAHATRWGMARFGSDVGATMLLLLMGPVTAAPLMLFAIAVRRLRMSTLGFLQFISPSIQFVIAVETGEPLDTATLIAFGLIWTGVVIFLAGRVVTSRRAAVVPLEAA